MANLRAAFRWATDRSDLVTAAAIAAHTAAMALWLLVLEPIGWAEELLPAATTTDIAQLPRLYTAAGLAGYVGRPEAGAEHARTALRLAVNDRYDPFHPAYPGWVGNAEMVGGGDVDHYVDEMSAMAGYEAGRTSVAADRSDLGQVIGLAGLAYMLPAVGRAEEARALAAHLPAAVAALAVYFDRTGQPETAATMYGITVHAVTTWLPAVPATLEHLRAALGESRFDECVAAGAAMEPGDAVSYARQQIRLARAGLGSAK